MDGAAASLSRHLARRSLVEMEHAGQIDRDDAVPRCRVEVEEIAAVADPGTIEEDVDPAEREHRRGDRLIDRIAVAHVETLCGGMPAGVADAPGGGFGRGRVDIGAKHGCPLARQRLGAGAADPAARPGDQRHLARDPAHAFLLAGDDRHYTRAAPGGSIPASAPTLPPLRGGSHPPPLAGEGGGGG